MILAHGLLPAYHAARLAEARAAFRWIAALALLLALAGALSAAVIASSPGPDPGTIAQIDDQNRLIADADKKAASWRSQAAQAARALDARKAVGEHPDWGLLIDRLAGAAPDAIALEDVAIALAPSPDKNPKARRWSVTIAGLAPKQTAVGALVSTLESWKLFDKVRLVETKARSVRSLEAVAFKIEASIEEGRRAEEPKR